MSEEVFTEELFRILGRVLGFAIAIIILAYVLEHLGIGSKQGILKSFLLDGALVASIAR
jgi:hypothetical protein